MFLDLPPGADKFPSCGLELQDNPGGGHPMTTEVQQWIWACTKRLAELHPGEPMELDDWENVATGLHQSAAGETPEKAAEAYTAMRASKAPGDD